MLRRLIFWKKKGILVGREYHKGKKFMFDSQELWWWLQGMSKVPREQETNYVESKNRRKWYKFTTSNLQKSRRDRYPSFSGNYTVHPPRAVLCWTGKIKQLQLRR